MIDIDPLDDFIVVKRLLGRHGNNMRTIAQEHNAKLRLRGQGSGFLEGVARQESDEQLQLNVSCTSYETYNEARKSCALLIGSIYKHYHRYCVNLGKREAPLLPVRYEELRRDDLAFFTETGLREIEIEDEQVVHMPDAAERMAMDAVYQVSSSGNGSHRVTSDADAREHPTVSSVRSGNYIPRRPHHQHGMHYGSETKGKGHQQAYGEKGGKSSGFPRRGSSHNYSRSDHHDGSRGFPTRSSSYNSARASDYRG
jgi:hypothetical protein